MELQALMLSGLYLPRYHQKTSFPFSKCLKERVLSWLIFSSARTTTIDFVFDIAPGM